jgi:AraC-like DNA-binding protein
MTTISILFIGFSIFIALILFVTYAFFIEHINKSRFTISLCGVMLASFSLVQFNHYNFYISNADPLSTVFYRFLILLIPSLFYFFNRVVLFPNRKISALQLLHFSPLFFAFIAPREVAVPIAFLIGAGYCLWLTGIVYKLRALQKRFRLILFFLGFFSLLAVLILFIGFTAFNFDQVYYYHFYSMSIGVSYLLVTATLISFPNVLNDIDEVLRIGYSNTTLSNIDIDASINKLKLLMENSKLYQNENISLAMLADEMELSNHQLSELINTRFNVGFSHYIRIQRVDEAKRLLRTDKKSSILSISMEVGFKSQSNFYAAFKEITGESPGNYRNTTSG